MNFDKPKLEVSIRTHLVPHLKNDGFLGSGKTFRRVINSWIQVVHIQGSQDGGQFAINLGLQHLKVPDALENEPNPKKLTETSCEFRRRLTESGADQWWKHDGLQAGMDSAVREAAQIYVRIGRAVLARIADVDSPLENITAGDLKNGDFDLLGFRSTKVRMALVLARIRKAQGRHVESRDFATYGLAHVGRAAGLRTKLERLATTT